MAIETKTRRDGRRADQLRPVTIETGVNIYAEGSALISAGNTRVLCLATLEDKVPPFRKGSGEGWVTAEYAMLPRATNTRNQRDGRQGRIDPGAFSQIRIVGIGNTNSDPTAAASAAAAFLQRYPDLAGIGCVEAAGGISAGTAVREAGRAGKVKILNKPE